MINFSDLTEKLNRINFSEYNVNNYRHYTTLKGLLNILETGKIKRHLAKGDDDFDIFNIEFEGYKNPCNYVKEPVVCFTSHGYNTGIQSFLGDKTNHCIGYVVLSDKINKFVKPTLDYLGFIPKFVDTIKLNGITTELLTKVIKEHDWENKKLNVLKQYIKDHEYKCPFDYSTDSENYFMFWLFANYLNAIPENKSMKIIEFRINKSIPIQYIDKIVLIQEIDSDTFKQINSYNIPIEQEKD